MLDLVLKILTSVILYCCNLEFLSQQVQVFHDFISNTEIDFLLLFVTKQNVPLCTRKHAPINPFYFPIIFISFRILTDSIFCNLKA